MLHYEETQKYTNYFAGKHFFISPSLTAVSAADSDGTSQDQTTTSQPPPVTNTPSPPTPVLYPVPGLVPTGGRDKVQSAQTAGTTGEEARFSGVRIINMPLNPITPELLKGALRHDTYDKVEIITTEPSGKSNASPAGPSVKSLKEKAKQKQIKIEESGKFRQQSGAEMERVLQKVEQAKYPTQEGSQSKKPAMAGMKEDPGKGH